MCSKCKTAPKKYKSYCQQCQTKAAYESRRKKVEKNKKFINMEKDVPCADCGIKYPPYVMDFDHIPGQTKSMNVSSMKTKAYGEISQEIAKCQVVCSNCHRERTHKRKNNQ